MKKGIKILIISLSIILVAALIMLLLYKNNKKEIEVSKEIEIYKDITLKELIDDDIEILDDYKINTESLGEQEIEVKYKNKIFKYKDKIKIVITDKEAPTLEVKDIKIEKGTETDITKDFKCTDNYDKNPKCYVEGSYNINEAGIYTLKYIGEDSSNNKSTKDFTLTVYEKVQEIQPTQEITGANQEKIVCTNSQNTSGIVMNSIINIYLNNSNFNSLDMTIEASLPEKYMGQKQAFASSIEKQYGDFEKEYGVKPNVTETDNGFRIDFNMTAEQAKEFYGSDDTTATRSEVIETFETQGFSCK